MSEIFFCWVEDFAGRPEPQIHHGEQTRDQRPVKVLKKNEIGEGVARLGLDELAKRYPYTDNGAFS